MNRRKLGSKTAKDGFKNEKDVVEKFNNWKNDKVAQEWLKIMGYKLETLNKVGAVVIPTRIKQSEIANYNVSSSSDYYELTKFKKADAQVRLVIKIGNILKVENISIKKANSNADYNQIDKRSVTTYKKMWRFDDEIEKWLKLFTGENIPSKMKSPHNKMLVKEPDKRLYMNEMPKTVVRKILAFFKSNKILIISDIFKGRGALSADWMLVTKYNGDGTTEWALVEINEVMNFYGKGTVKISPRGSINIGRITVQRKGGTPDPTSLQFKFHPCDIFNIRKS